MDAPQIPHFMPGGLGDYKKMTEDEEAKAGYKLSKHINDMDAELKDRFKALKVLQDTVHDLDEEEQREMRKLEIQFEEKYKEIYAARELLINGKVEIDQELIK